jgi:phage terminase large subunit
MSTEITIHLNKFKPREYQLPVCQAIASEGGKYRKLLVINPRRSGKDFCAFALLVRAAIREVGLYLYCLPTQNQSRSVIWEGKSNTGEGFLDFIPPQLILKMRNDTMTIYLVNQSIIRFVGSDNYDRSIVGSNPKMIVFSEYAMSDENAYKLAAMPIMKGNNGIVMLISTPRGKNHMYELHEIARNNPDWFVQFLTIDDTRHISSHDVQREIESGEISESLALQEYWCSFDHGDEHSYYAKLIAKMYLKGQIGNVPWEPYHKVYTAWDFGLKDPCVIIFFQVIGDIVRIFDYYEASDKLIAHFAQFIANKEADGMIFERHFPPHDVMKREESRGLSRRELYAELGVKFTEPVKIGIEDGIEGVRRSLGKIWIDEKKCARLIKCLENYQEEYDAKRRIYRGYPRKDQYTHGADAMRYLCAALPRCGNYSSAAKIEKNYKEAVYGDKPQGGFFREDLPEY